MNTISAAVLRTTRKHREGIRSLMRRRIPAASIAAALALPLGFQGQEAGGAVPELVTNGGFESGNFNGWTLSGNLVYTNVGTSTIHAGTFAAVFGSVGSTASISQLVTTVAGRLYAVSYFLQNDGGTPNSFAASFGGATLASGSNLAAQPFMQADFAGIRAATASTPLAFTIRQDPAYFHLDDISVTQVPPATHWLGATDGKWTGNVNNWANDAAGTPTIATPMALDDVTFSATGAANQKTTLEQDFTIKSLTITDANLVSIASGTGGPHTLTLSGVAGSGITVNAGANLSISANVTLGGSSDTIAVNGTGVATISGTLGGANGLIKEGTGLLTLAGRSTYTGGTTLNAGTLAAGSAKAFGNGNLTMTAGTLRTDGPLTVDIGAGNILFGGGTYVANVGGTTAGVNHDQLKTTGSAKIGGGTLALVRQGGYILAPGDKVKLLLATGGVAGGSATGTPVAAASVAGLAAFSNNPLLVPTVNLYTDKVILEAMQGSFVSLFGTLPFTPNQMAIASSLDSAAALLGKKTGLIAEFNFLDTQPIGTLLDNLNKISPASLTAISSSAVALANVQSTNLGQHLADLHSGSPTTTASGMAAAGSGPSFSGPKGKSGTQVAPANEDRWGMFLTGSGEFARVGSTTSAAGFHFETGGVTGGLDYRVNDHFAIGLDFGYVGTTATLVNGGSIDTDGGRLGLYATYFNKNFHVDAAVNGGLNSYKTKRVTPNNTVATASPNGSEINILLSTGYDWKIGKLTLGPTASYQYTNVRLDGFTEAGAFLPLAVTGQNTESSRTSFGLHATYEMQVGKVLVRPEARVSWQHEFGATASSITSRFANIGGTPFTVTGPKIGRDSLLVGAGVSVQWTPRMATYVYYDGEIGRTNYSSHSVSGGFRFQF